jgi:hypothetical protein
VTHKKDNRRRERDFVAEIEKDADRVRDFIRREGHMRSPDFLQETTKLNFPVHTASQHAHRVVSWVYEYLPNPEIHPSRSPTNPYPSRRTFLVLFCL